MQVTGAIFDCDGTLVDSMRVWRNVFGAVLPKYGKTVDSEFFERVEAVSLMDAKFALIIWSCLSLQKLCMKSSARM